MTYVPWSSRFSILDLHLQHITYHIHINQTIISIMIMNLGLFCGIHWCNHGWMNQMECAWHNISFHSSFIIGLHSLIGQMGILYNHAWKKWYGTWVTQGFFMVFSVYVATKPFIIILLHSCNWNNTSCNHNSTCQLE
jgi:hypothetical protein